MALFFEDRETCCEKFGIIKVFIHGIKKKSL